jgi:hypothetical protein
VYASWAVVIPVEAWSGGIASTVLSGAFAGLMPGRSSVSDAAGRGIANGMSGKWISIEGHALRPRVRISVASYGLSIVRAIAIAHGSSARTCRTRRAMY